MLRGSRSTASRCGSAWSGSRPPQQRLAWLADHLAEQPGVGIVYCLTVAATQEVADYLRSRGHDVAAYSGQTEATERHALEQDLVAGRVKALIATSALGMGFDATLGFVVNMGAPPSPVAYYQQVGRAGRGTDEATVVLLPAIEDRDIWAYFASLAFPREEQVRQTLDALRRGGARSAPPALETRVELSRTRLETMLKVLDVDGAVRRVRGGWEATGQPWSYDEERYARVREAREREQRGDARLPRHRPRAGCASSASSSTTPEAPGLRALRQLRRPEPRRGRVRARRSRRPGPGWPGPAYPSSRARCGRPRWPTLGVDLKGKIAEGAEEGRAVARLTDLGHGQALRALFRPDTPDGPVPVPLVQRGAHDARRLAARGRRDRGGRVVHPADPDRRPGRAACRAGSRCRSSGHWAIVDPDVAPGRGAANSAQRVAAVGRRCRLCRPTCPPARGCCSSTTWSSPAGPSPSPPARSAPPAPSAVLPLTLAVQS